MVEYRIPRELRGYINPVSHITSFPRSALPGEKCVVTKDCDGHATADTTWIWNGSVWVCPATDIRSIGVYDIRKRKWLEVPKATLGRVQIETANTCVRILSQCETVEEGLAKIRAHFWPDRETT